MEDDLVLNPKPDEFVLAWVVAMSDRSADQLLTDKVSHDMWVKLQRKREDGRGGWHGPNVSNADLLGMLRKNLDAGDMIDVINLAGMIHCRTALYGDSA